jgi:uncharacterized protein YcbX
MATAPANPGGSVVALWRYPVKSMMGEELNASDITERGLLGDRAFALVDADTGVENNWIGRTLSLGSEVQLHVTQPCPRCVMTTPSQGDLPKDPGILRAAVQHN